jgi:oligopeptide/dipeptide ABC transporter ATP-binding protein
MRQRVMIAIALACDPELLIADEPTTALDSLAAAQINALLADLKRQGEMSLLLISHDVASVAETSDWVVVMYAGQVAEQGPTASVLRSPHHPYTRALLQSVPPLRARRRRRHPTPTRLPALRGGVPTRLGEPPRGCRFADRCPEVFDRCRAEDPRLVDAGDGVEARCFLVEEGVVLPLTRTITEAPISLPSDDQEPESEKALDNELEEVLEQDSVRAQEPAGEDPT